MGEGGSMRNWWTATFGILISLPLGVFWLDWSLERASEYPGVDSWQIVFLSLFFPCLIWLILKSTFFPKVVLTRSGVVVCNLFVKYEIPVGRVTRVFWGGGLVFKLDGGEFVYSFGFGGSLLGEILGHSRNRERVRKIEKHLLSISPAGNDSDPIRRHPHLNAIFLVSFSVFSFVFNKSMEGIMV